LSQSNKEDPSTYCLVVTTRSGKVLQSELDISREEVINAKEEPSSNIGLASRKVGIFDDVLVQVGRFMLPEDFVILDYAVDVAVIFKVDRGMKFPMEFACIVMLDELDDMEEGDLEGVLSTIQGLDHLMDIVK
ncbi:hypothetical protein HAX54_009372, partial [Datura stramonium]|nr:hypothetical protein [Datura stramonium]